MTEFTSVKKANVLFWVAPAALVGLLFLTLGVGLVGLYVYSSDAWPFVALAKALPFPAALVNGEIIRYSEWSDDTRAFLALAESGKVAVSGAATRHEIAKNVMDRLVRNRIMAALAAEKGVTIADSEIEKEFSAVAANAGEQKSLEEMLKALGWSDQDVKDQIVRPYLLGRRLSERLGSTTAAEALVADALQKANIKIFVKF